MPTLIRPQRIKQKRPIPFDGTKTDFYKRVNLVHPGGSEGEIHQVRIGLTGKKRSQLITLIEKVFHPKDHPSVKAVSYTVRKNNPHLWKPEEQFELISRIRRINFRRKLGLRFPRTIRLGKNEDGTMSIYTTPLQVLNPYELNPKEEDAFYADMDRQMSTLGRLGVRILKDAFFCCRDPTTQSVIAVIGDFGTISMERYRKK